MSLIEQVTQQDVLPIPSKRENLLSKYQKDQNFEMELPTTIRLLNSCEIQFGNTNIQMPLILPTNNVYQLQSISSLGTPKPMKVNFSTKSINQQAGLITYRHQILDKIIVDRHLRRYSPVVVDSI